MESFPEAHDRKQSDSGLAPLERRLIPVLLPRVPPWLQSHHLTLLTVMWSGLVIAAATFARRDKRWLWAFCAAIALQYVTDAIDGKIGKARGAGLVRWGYYMDHLLDYVFVCAVLAGYTILLPQRYHYLMALAVAICGGFMVSAFLARSVTGVLRISYLGIGGVEVRLLFIGINVWIATAGKEYMLQVLPYVLAGSAMVLAALVYQTQRSLWDLDLAARQPPAAARAP